MDITKKLMDKAIKDGKPWNYGLLQYRVMPISSTIPSPLEALTGRKLRTSLPQVSSTIGRTVDGSRICQELIKRQPHASTQHGMDLKPGQPVFVKEVQGNVWKTATVDQPAKEPNSYWVWSPDNSILRRTCQMIKPSPYLLIWNWRCRVKRGTPHNTGPPTPCRVSRQYSLSWDSKPYQQAIRLHQHCRNHPISGEVGHCHQFPRFLPCYPFHTEEINPIYKGHPAQEVLSLKSTSHAETLTSLQSGICVH